MRLIAAVAVMLLTLSGCAGRQMPEQDAPTTIGDISEAYFLEPGNRVRVIVFNESNLSGEFQIDPSGKLSMPLIGTVQAAGVNAKTLAKRVEEVLTRSNYMRDPKVAIEVASYRPFYVLGEVKQAGEFPYQLGMTVLSAVARAGGYDYRAREEDVILVRVVDGKEQYYRASERTPILPGDIVRVLERHF